MKGNKSQLLNSTIFRAVFGFSCVFIMLQVGIIISTVNYNRSMLQRQSDGHVSQILHLCQGELDKAVDIADRMLKYILAQDAYLRLLDSSRENVAYHSRYQLSNRMDLGRFSNDFGKTYVIARTDGTILIERRGEDFTYQQLNTLKDYLAEIGATDEVIDSEWYLQEIDGKWYLAHYYIPDRLIVMALIDLNGMWTGLLQDSRTLRVAGPDVVLTIGESGLQVAQEAGDAIEHRIELEMPDLKLTLSMSSTGEQDLNAGQPMTIVLSCMICLVFTVGLLLYLNREYKRPIADLEQVTHRIEEGDFKYRARLKCSNRELQGLAASFNSMMDMIIQLKIEQYEHIIRRQDIELKYYYMQIRPHFFLNALTSMQGMALRGENRRVSDYIVALSKNIRYMFNAGFERTRLRREMEHIDDYIRCQEILMPGCVFTYMDMTNEAGEWMVPQMILHTFVENVYKHVVSADRVVSILIRAEVVGDPGGGGERLLRVILEDDGDGFPLPVLKAFEENDAEAEAMKNSIGLFNIRRTLELMYGRNDLLSIKNNHSAGCKIVLHIPADVMTERREER